MISHKFRCIFVHIPKTAGNSINRIFGIDWENHKDLARYAQETRAVEFESYFKFAIVRNPWDRLLSDYNFQKKKRRDKKSKLHLFSERGLVRSFSEWIDAVLADPFHYPPHAWGADVSDGLHRWSPQIDWVTLNGRVAVDEVLRLEDLDREFPRVCKQLGVSCSRIPKRNSKFHWHYSFYYDESTRQKVTDYYSADIKRFGYSFEMRGCELFRKCLGLFLRQAHCN